MLENDLREAERAVARRPEDAAAWLRLCRSASRRQRPELLRRHPLSDELRAELWGEALREHALLPAVLPLFGLEIPTRDEPDPGEFWLDSPRFGAGADHDFDRYSGLPLRVRRRSDGGVMVLVPEGSYCAMSGRGDGTERTHHRPSLPAFYVDRSPITVAQYQRFLEATGGAPPPHFEVQLRRPRRPVVFVSHADASRYAVWAGAFLVGTSGWEKAARGTDARPYPWGDLPVDAERANTGFARAKDEAEADWDRRLDEVEDHPSGRSPFGIHDAVGNVREWVGPPASPSVRGSSFLSRASQLALSRNARDGGQPAGDLSFRLARSASPRPGPSDHARWTPLGVR